MESEFEDSQSRTVRVPLPVYGWARYTCWVAIAVSYWETGLSKLRVGRAILVGPRGFAGDLL